MGRTVQEPAGQEQVSPHEHDLEASVDLESDLWVEQLAHYSVGTREWSIDLDGGDEGQGLRE